MYRTDNPLADWDNYCKEQEEEIERLPKCSECGEPITDDTCFNMHGDLICENCMDSNYRVYTYEFVQGE